MAVDRIKRRAKIVDTELPLDDIARAISTRGHLTGRSGTERTEIHPVFERAVEAGVLGVAHAGRCPLEADQSEGTRTTHGVIGEDPVQRQRILSTEGQRPICWRTKTSVSRGIERLAGFAGIGVRGLGPQRHAIVLHDRRQSVGKFPGCWNK